MIWQEELIGKTAIIIDKKTNHQTQGLIVDETQHTITLDDQQVLKKQVTIHIGHDMIDGEKIAMRSCDRIKGNFKKQKVYSL